MNKKFTDKRGGIENMKQSKNLKTSIEEDADIEKLCLDTAGLVEYARNTATQQVNIV